MLVARGDMKTSMVTWGADTASVASSGDLGLTFGVIRQKYPTAGSDSGEGSCFHDLATREQPESVAVRGGVR